MKTIRFNEVKEHIGKRVKIRNHGDIAIHGELRKFLYDEENKYELIIDKITKGGRVIVRHGKHTFSLTHNDIELFEM